MDLTTELLGFDIFRSVAGKRLSGICKAHRDFVESIAVGISSLVSLVKAYVGQLTVIAWNGAIVGLQDVNRSQAHRGESAVRGLLAFLDILEPNP